MTAPAAPDVGGERIMRIMSRWPNISDAECQLLMDAGLVECSSSPYSGGTLSSYRVRQHLTERSGK